MTRRILLGGIAVLLLSGACWMALQAATRTQDAADVGGRAAGYREPEILLHRVEIREIRKGGASGRVLASRASYRVLSRSLLAEQVTFTTESGNGRVHVEAPRLSWDLQEGRLELPEGGTARNGSGWNIEVPDARIDLPERMLTANRATFSMPGIQVAGGGLTWRWKEGTVELISPESRVLPGPLRSGAGRGRMP